MRMGMRLVAGIVASCLSISSAKTDAGGTPLTTVRVASGLNRPLFVTHAPGDFDRIYIVEKPGTIKVLKDGVVSVFLDITARVGGSGSLNTEQGLLGLAFHPDFANNKLFYVNYTISSGNGRDTSVSRFIAFNGDLANAGTEFVIMSISQPQENHNGGWMAFGPDGFLYIATGDGGNADDEGSGHTAITGNAQDITNNLLGKILRIDVDGGVPYAIPPDNPFVGITGDDEIWAYGLRNPWRNAFDSETGDLYIADVGQGVWEEISYQAASSTGGENYGWRCREGAHDFDITANCIGETFVEPFHEYSHGGSPFRCSITGGEVYRGCAIPDLGGTYFFSDWCSRTIWSIRRQNDGTFSEFEDRTSELAPGGGLLIANMTSFGTDALGEMYICDHSSNGEVYKIVADGGPSNDCNNNGVEDSCDIAAGTSPDDDTNGVPDECETAATPLPPDVAWPKNRYLTFKPNNIAAVALQVELSASLNHPGAVGLTRWVDVPDGIGIAQLSNSPVTRIWTEEEVHATGCEISPLATYQIRATVDGGKTFSAPLPVATSPLPLEAKFWGDTVGSFDGAQWSAPQQVVNFDDVVAAIRKWQELPGAPHTSVCDLEPQFINAVVNFNDVLFTIFGFLGEPYPFGCPADPCQNNIANPCP